MEIVDYFRDSCESVFWEDRTVGVFRYIVSLKPWGCQMWFVDTEMTCSCLTCGPRVPGPIIKLLLKLKLSPLISLLHLVCLIPSGVLRRMRGLTCSPQVAPGNKVRDQDRVISMVCQVRLDPTQSGFIVQIPRIDGGLWSWKNISCQAISEAGLSVNHPILKTRRERETTAWELGVFSYPQKCFMQPWFTMLVRTNRSHQFLAVWQNPQCRIRPMSSPCPGLQCQTSLVLTWSCLFLVI